MERKDYLVILAAAVLVVAAFLLLKKPNTVAPFVVKGDATYLASFLESNTVVVRVIYPFSDTQGAINAAVYLTTVFTAKGKTVILQYVDGNTCYTNEGNVYTSVEVDVNRCLLPYPTFQIREGSNLIIIEENTVDLYGDPPHLMPAAAYVAKLIYPDADEVYHTVMGRLKNLRPPAS